MPGSPALTSDFLHSNEMQGMGRTSTLLVLAELSWHCSLVQGYRELPKPRTTATLSLVFSSSDYNPSKTSHPRSPLGSSNFPSGLKINENLTSSKQSNESCQKQPFSFFVNHSLLIFFTHTCMFSILFPAALHVYTLIDVTVGK